MAQRIHVITFLPFNAQVSDIKQYVNSLDVFIANDPSYDLSQIDCGLLGENMILSAWSMGIGSCCLGGPTRFMTSTPAAAEYLKKLDIPEGYQLLYCIAFGYPDETPAAKPRNAAKVKFID